MSRFFLIPFLLIFSFLGACDGSIEGQFGWSATDDRDLGPREKRIRVETEFRVQRNDLYFLNYQTIWWVYEIQAGSYELDAFIVALYSRTNAPNPVEVDLRQVRVRKGPESGFIRQSYEPLDPGRYLIKIAYQEKVVDQVEFQVVPPGGPGAYRESDDPDREEELEKETDPIIKYSS